MGTLHRWVEDRLTAPLTDLLRGMFSDLVFAQHVKVALMRFDGEVQRLRFTLGDDGIVPTAEAGDKLGEHPVRTADRLGAFIDLLCDAGILRWEQDKVLMLGPCRLPSEAAANETFPAGGERSSSATVVGALGAFGVRRGWTGGGSFVVHPVPHRPRPGLSGSP